MRCSNRVAFLRCTFPLPVPNHSPAGLSAAEAHRRLLGFGFLMEIRAFRVRGRSIGIPHSGPEAAWSPPRTKKRQQKAKRDAKTVANSGFLRHPPPDPFHWPKSFPQSSFFECDMAFPHVICFPLDLLQFAPFSLLSPYFGAPVVDCCWS